ncbi:uncharacterized protein I206_107311 [Kwoniella pini CBS 10737]|uniref:WSC domain-containing protein n=1 Tax=Kwoniella pini CBS 10737 TaxID=1296096 RepID=A0A1B9HYQ4_9TREE|nr:uncharacterized protein I206_05145 [Kwoniella pini CBS 10737]OCF48368.1 hypothetical protein I206_05145 [Kwoniella pini CBS 10737]
MHISNLLSILILLQLEQVLAWTDPFFVIQHGPDIITSRIDPVISPGGISSHVHSIVGSSSFKPTYTYENSRAGRCTTANIAIDHSNYWTPQLYRKRDDGKFDLIKMNRANTYYLMRRGSQNEQVYDFPPGFRMVAGNPSRTTYNASNYADNAISYVCLGVNGARETGAFPTQSCPNDLRAQVFFPNCWDGVNTYLPNSAHVAYPLSQGYNSGGPCPKTHPKRILSIFYEFHFTDNFEYKEGSRIWATGDDIGYSLHADFTFGWPKGFLPTIFPYGEQCAVDFSLENCPPLKPLMTTNGSACTPDPGLQIVNEDIGTNNPIVKLPGNNPIWGRSGPKKPDPNYKETAQFTTSTIPIPSGWKKVGCLAEPSGSRALTAASTTNQTMTPTKCLNFCASKGYTLAGVEWSVECYCGNSLTKTSLSAIDNNLACDMPCNGLDYSAGYCGGSSKLTIYQKSNSAVVSSSASKASVSTSKASTSTSKASTSTSKATSTSRATSTSTSKATSRSTSRTSTTTSKQNSTAKTSTTTKKTTSTSSSKSSSSAKSTLNIKNASSTVKTSSASTSTSTKLAGHKRRELH